MNFRHFAILPLLCMFFISSYADNDVKSVSNVKFIKDAAKEVWEMQVPDFDPKANVPAQKYDGESAVYIADYVFVNADFEQTVGKSKSEISRTSMKSDMNNGHTLNDVTICKIVRRCMVKLLDQQAVDYFSILDLANGGSDTVAILGGSYKTAIGARVHKVDGSIDNVNVAKYLKSSNVYGANSILPLSLQIPDLEVGDVLEYFTYTYDELDGEPLPTQRIDLLQHYPTMKFGLQGIFDPALTVEYRAINGCPQIGVTNDSRGNLIATAEFTDLPAIPTDKLFLRSRQLPYYCFTVLENTSNLVWHPKGARKPGIHADISPSTYYREISEYLARTSADRDLVVNAAKYMMNYMAEHPDASRRDLVDRAWIAMLYYYIDDDHDDNDIALSLSFREILRKLGLDGPDTGIGFVNGRQSFPTDCLLSYADVDYFVVVDGVPYYASNSCYMAPGEFPGEYQGETAGVLYSDFRNFDANLLPKPFEIPTTTFNNNLLYNTLVLDIDTNAANKPVNFDLSVQVSGAVKDQIGLNVDKAVLADALRDYLEIPTVRKPKDIDDVTVIDATESILGVRPSMLTGKSIADFGCLPDAKKIKLQTSGVIEGLVADAGDGKVLVNIGKLFGKNSKLLGNDRERKYEAFLFAPNQAIYSVTLKVPDGYVADTESINALNSNINNSAGCYQVKAAVTDDGRSISLYTLDRKMRYVVPTVNWPDLLEILDASAAFNDTSIVLSPAK